MNPIAYSGGTAVLPCHTILLSLATQYIYFVYFAEMLTHFPACHCVTMECVCNCAAFLCRLPQSQGEAIGKTHDGIYSQLLQY